MKSLTISVPAKTFIAGEYLALKGQGALVFCSEPYFKIKISQKPSLSNPFHSQSQAGKFWHKHEDFFSQFSIDFFSPLALGGLGASTAEFISLHALFQLQESIWVEQERFLDIHEMLNDYLSLSPQNYYLPSGADLVAQVQGGFTYFHKESGKIQTFFWPFSDLVLLLIGTKIKLATHEHLKNLSHFDSTNLDLIMQQMHDSLKTLKQSDFVLAFNAYAEELKRLGFLVQHCQKMIEDMQDPGILGKKGCGALGADIVALLVERPYAEQIKNKYNVISSSDEIAHGVHIFLEKEALLDYRG